MTDAMTCALVVLAAVVTSGSVLLLAILAAAHRPTPKPEDKRGEQ